MVDQNKIIMERLNGWNISKVIGAGGFKEVFLIENGTLQEALKITKYFDPSSTGTTEADDLETMLRARTERECQLLEKFGGNEVVTLGSIPYQEIIIEENTFSYYSEEYLPGITLHHLNQQNKTSNKLPSLQSIHTLFLTGIHVIERFWNNKIIHRDIKPLNIMMTGLEHRPVVFFDLGIAFDHTSTSLTSHTFGPGTLRYRAPETLDPDYRASIDFRCDLFSLAVTVYEYAAGFHPIHHGSMSDGETVYRLLNKIAEPLNMHRPDLGENFCEIIDKCIKRAPALRPNRISEIRKSLGE